MKHEALLVWTVAIVLLVLVAGTSFVSGMFYEHQKWVSSQAVLVTSQKPLPD